MAISDNLVTTMRGKLRDLYKSMYYANAVKVTDRRCHVSNDVSGYRVMSVASKNPD